MKTKFLFSLLLLTTFISCNHSARELTPLLKVSDNKRYLATENGDPFFWLGDTGWMLFSKLTREEAARYLDDRKQKGFNVIQVMVLHNVMNEVNVEEMMALFIKIFKSILALSVTTSCSSGY